MEATAKSFTFLGNESLIRVPFFQRSYVWKKENWEDLLEDLSDGQKSHFLGSLILKQQKTLSGEPKEALVIDGQQRLTTLSVLLKALYDCLPTDIKQNVKNSIRQHLFYKRAITDQEYHVKLQHSHADSSAYTDVIVQGIDTDLINLQFPNHRISRCYSHFVSVFRSKSATENSSLFNLLLDVNNKCLVVIDLNYEDDEQAIFDTINSAGIRLTSADIIKNALFQRVIHLDGQANAITLFQQTWFATFSADEASIQFWETQRPTGRLMRDNLEILLHSVAVIEGFYDPEKSTLGDLSRLYKTKINSLDLAHLKKFIAVICEYGDLYRRKIITSDPSTLYFFGDGEQRLFHILNTLEISTFHPYVLFLFKAYASSPSDLECKLSNLESFVMRSLVSRTDTKSFSKLTKSFILNTAEVERRKTEILDAQVELGLQSISNKLASVILFWIELKRRHDDSKCGLKHLKYDYTLEHVMPQKWEQFWTLTTPKTRPDGSIIPLEEAKAERASRIYWLGNMTLLTSSLNTSLRNHCFERKVEGEGRKKGINAYDDLFITKEILEPYSKGDKIWDEDKIQKRNLQLVQEACSIWK